MILSAAQSIFIFVSPSRIHFFSSIPITCMRAISFQMDTDFKLLFIKTIFLLFFPLKFCLVYF